MYVVVSPSVSRALCVQLGSGIVGTKSTRYSGFGQKAKPKQNQF